MTPSNTTPTGAAETAAQRPATSCPCGEGCACAAGCTCGVGCACGSTCDCSPSQTCGCL